MICPALDYGDFEELKRKYGQFSRVFPLPDAAGVKPALIIKPHRNLAAIEGSHPEIANTKEI